MSKVIRNVKTKLDETFKVDGGVLKIRNFMSYGFGGFGQNLIYGIMSSYLTIFYTDIMGIAAATVGTMFLVAKIWDAINDPIMGSLVDKTRTKWGKMRPYMLFTPIPIAIITILLFIVPDFSYKGKIVYMYATYILWGMFYTVNDVPYWSLSSVMTPNEQERTNLLSVTRILTSAGIGAPTVIVSALFFLQDKDVLTGSITQSKGSIYLTTALVCSIVGAGLMFLSFTGTKEVVKQSEKKPTMKESFVFLFTNKPLMMILLCNLLAFPKNLIWTAQPYVAEYLLGSQKWIFILGIPYTVGNMISYAITPFLMKKFGGIKSYIIALVYAFLPMGILYFIGYSSIPIILVFSFLNGLSAGVTSVVPSVLIADCVDYTEWKTGQRAEGVSFSIQTFMTKASAALQSYLGGIILKIIGYQANVPQTPATEKGLWLMYTILPVALSVFSVIPLFFYDLKGEKLEKVRSELKERRQKSESAV